MVQLIVSMAYHIPLWEISSADQEWVENEMMQDWENHWQEFLEYSVMMVLMILAYQVYQDADCNPVAVAVCVVHIENPLKKWKQFWVIMSHLCNKFMYFMYTCTLFLNILLSFGTWKVKLHTTYYTYWSYFTRLVSWGRSTFTDVFLAGCIALEANFSRSAKLLTCNAGPPARTPAPTPAPIGPPTPSSGWLALSLHFLLLYLGFW